MSSYIIVTAILIIRQSPHYHCLYSCYINIYYATFNEHIFILDIQYASRSCTNIDAVPASIFLLVNTHYAQCCVDVANE